jgi:hypothetical protein
MSVFGTKSSGGEKMRELIDGKLVEELEDPVDLTIHTKCPEKWLLIDLETGQEYIGQKTPSEYGKWKRIKDKSKNLIYSAQNVRFND